jgi:hypothetical protein
VNKGKKRKGRSYDARPFVIPRAGLGLSLRPGSLLSGSLSHSLGTPPHFKTRRHILGGLALHKRQLTAIGSDELIVTRATPKGEGACAICLDAIRPRESLVTSDLAVNVLLKDRIHLSVAVKDITAGVSERELVIALDLNPISGE